MKYFVLILILFVVAMIIYAIYWYVPDISEDVERQIEIYTGYSRNYLPKSITSELNYLNFSRKGEIDKEYVYYYKVDDFPNKRLILIVASEESNVMFGDMRIENIISENETKKIYSITLSANQEIPVIVVQSVTKPSVYIGIPK